MTATERTFVILLIEDQPATAHLVSTALSGNRVVADVRQVIDGSAAFDYLRRHGPGLADAPRPDLILLELDMPRMDGRGLLAAMKQEADFCDIPVVVLTASEVERDIVDAYHLGAAGYLARPADARQFMAAIRDLGDYWFDLVRLPQRDRVIQ